MSNLCMSLVPCVVGGGVLFLLLPAPPTEGKVRRSLLNLPMINPERLRMARVLVDKAVKVLLNSVTFPYLFPQIHTSVS